MVASGSEDDSTCVIWSRTDEIKAGVYDAAMSEEVRQHFPKLAALKSKGEEVKVDHEGKVYRQVVWKTPCGEGMVGCWAAQWETVPSDGHRYGETLLSDFFNPKYGVFYKFL